MNPSTPVSPTPSTFTAAQLAAALSVSKAAVLQRLGAVPAVVLHGRGGETKSWPVSVLPDMWRQRLDIQASRHRCRDAEHYVKSLAEPWQPRDARDKVVPLASIEQRWIDRADHLRTALAELLKRQHEYANDRAGLIAFGLRKFDEASKICTSPHARKSIGAKQWERLFDRTIERDRGNENWDRLEIYLDEPAFLQAAQPKPSRDKARFTHHELDPVVEALKKLKKPTIDDLDWLFTEAFKRFELLQVAHSNARDQRAVKASLIEYLFSRGLPLSRAVDPDGQRRMFDAKFTRWIERGRPVDLDRRHMNSGNFRAPDFSKDYREIAKASVVSVCNESGARRQTEDDGKLSEEFLQYSPCDRRTNKSGGLTKKGRRITTAMAEATVDLYRGPKAERDNGAYIVRDWSDERPGDWFVLDDVSWEFYWRPGAMAREGVLKGECLVGTDAVSDYPLGHLLIDGPYNAQHIRQLIKLLHASHGLPRKGFILEGAVWRARFVQGEKPGHGWQDAHWREVLRELAHHSLQIGIREELGINDPRLGLTNHHATTPGAKPIESVFRRVQARMCRLPLHVGANERKAGMERVQKLKECANRGDETALAQFLTQREMNAAIIAEFEAFAHDPGNGDRLQGRSPAGAWNGSLLDRALRKLTPSAEVLLSTHEKIVRLDPTIRGFSTRLPGRKTPVCYVNEHTEALLFKGEKQMRVRIDIDNLELATGYDMKGTTRFLVKGQMADAMSASREHLADLAKQRRASKTQSRALWGEIRHQVRSTIKRDNNHDEQLAEEAQFHRAEVEAHKAEEQADTRKRRKIGAAIGNGGRVQNPDRVLKGIAWENELKAELEAEAQSRTDKESNA